MKKQKFSKKRREDENCRVKKDVEDIPKSVNFQYKTGERNE